MKWKLWKYSKITSINLGGRSPDLEVNSVARFAPLMRREALL